MEKPSDDSAKLRLYPEVVLDDYDSAESLKFLGMDHLKHALEGCQFDPLMELV